METIWLELKRAVVAMLFVILVIEGLYGYAVLFGTTTLMGSVTNVCVSYLTKKLVRESLVDVPGDNGIALCSDGGISKNEA